MKTCPNCNAELKTSSIFCTECGFSFDSVEKKPETISQPNYATATPVQPSFQPSNISGPVYPGACNKCKLLFPAGTFTCFRCNDPLTFIVDVPPAIKNKIPPTGLDLTSFSRSSSSSSGKG
jgi:predicted amidophosphoribosyltransferase